MGSENVKENPINPSMPRDVDVGVGTQQPQQDSTPPEPR